MKRRRVGKDVYNSSKWQKVRKAYLASVNYICEICGKPAEIVHHKIHLTAENVRNPKISYNQDNLMALCRDCHNREHQNNFQKAGAIFSESGDVVDVYLDSQNVCS